ncbi:MAG: hypothetical protein GX896_07815 [Clostridiales bacterium]|nr:hypothetical protein [Clostridiales bacterium]
MPHTYEELRIKYPEFVYNGFDITENNDKIVVDFHFSITGLSDFSPRWTFDKKDNLKCYSDDKTFNEMLFSLGMTELVSYWKITCSPVVNVTVGELNIDQINFWKQLYFSGLGEFFYRNEINVALDDFMTIKCNGKAFEGISNQVSDNERCLIAIGGGKDSIASLEVLKSNFENNYCYIINPRGATLKTAKIAGYGDDKIVSFKRTLDKNMIELNKKGFLNGHTPFSAIVAFSSIIGAYLNNIKYVVLSNEASANESTVKNSDVNHQYSKSFKFEEDFHNYEKEFIKSGVYYFSLLRPMSELQIAKSFAKHEKYHSIFKSCNVGSKEDIWCKSCSKCLFVSLILSPYLSLEKIYKIFDTEILNDKNMLEDFEKLVGMTDEKPFECVGSIDEINIAVTQAIKKLDENGEKLPYLFEYYKATPLYNEYKNKPNRFKGYFEEENLLPEKFKKLLIDQCYDGGKDFD